MGHKRKKPRSKFSSTSEKIPRIQKGIEKGVVSWHLGIIDKDGPYGWDQVNPSTIWGIINKLSNFEKLTWNEIINRNNHPIRVASICPEAKKRLGEINQEDNDDLMSLHIDGIKRIWGIADGNILKILWWDPYHKVYPIRKRHT